MDKYAGNVAGGRSISGDDLASAVHAAQCDETLLLSDGRALVARLRSSDGDLAWVPLDDRDTKKALNQAVGCSQMGSMLLDRPRVQAYSRAIVAAVADFRSRNHRAPVVLDIGAGTGLLSMIAARAGAARVYALEMYKPLAQLAARITTKYTGSAATNAFGEPVCDIHVIGKDSSRVSVGASTGSAGSSSGEGTAVEPPDMATRADLCVNEIYDSALLGEGVIPALRDAYSRLLAPNAVVVPRGARVLAQLVCAPVADGLAGRAWGRDGDVACSAENGPASTGPSSGSATPDDVELSTVPPIPLHADRLLPSLHPAGAPFHLHHFRFDAVAFAEDPSCESQDTAAAPRQPSASSSECVSGRSRSSGALPQLPSDCLGVPSASSVRIFRQRVQAEAPAPRSSTGTSGASSRRCNASLLWWELDLWDGVTYSTCPRVPWLPQAEAEAPAAAGAAAAKAGRTDISAPFWDEAVVSAPVASLGACAGPCTEGVRRILPPEAEWQDHWTQCLVPFDAELEDGDALIAVVRGELNFRMAARNVASTKAAAGASAAVEGSSGTASESHPSKRARVEDGGAEKLSRGLIEALSGSSSTDSPQLSTHSPWRLRELRSASRQASIRSALSQLKRRIESSADGDPRPIFLLDVADGCEASRLACCPSSATVQATCSPGTSDADKYSQSDVDDCLVLCCEGHPTMARDSSLSCEASGLSARVSVLAADAGVVAGIPGAGLAGLWADAGLLGGAERRNAVGGVLALPTAVQLTGRPLWAAASALFRRVCVEPVLRRNPGIPRPPATHTTTAPTLPAAGFLMASVVELQDLWKNHASVSECDGFDHSELVDASEGWESREFGYPLFMYHHKYLAPPQCVAVLDFVNPTASSAISGPEPRGAAAAQGESKDVADGAATGAGAGEQTLAHVAPSTEEALFDHAAVLEVIAGNMASRHVLAFETSGTAHALVAWVDYALTEQAAEQLKRAALQRAAHAKELAYDAKARELANEMIHGGPFLPGGEPNGMRQSMRFLHPYRVVAAASKSAARDSSSRENDDSSVPTGVTMDVSLDVDAGNGLTVTQAGWA